MKSKGVGNAGAQAMPIIVNTGGGNGPLKIVAGLLGLGVLGVVGKKMYDTYQKNKGEANITSPAGSIALQLKNVFDSFPVSDADYKAVKLQVTPDLSPEVYKIYKQITGRNLSDDEANHINSGTQTTVAKQQAINSVPGTTIKVTPDDKIQFLIGKGNLIMANPGAPGKRIPLYAKPEDIANGKPFRMLDVSPLKLTVEATKEVPYQSYKTRAGWTKILLPLVKTRKVFAAIGFSIPLKGGKKTQTLWVDARTVLIHKANSVHGLGQKGLVNLL